MADTSEGAILDTAVPSHLERFIAPGERGLRVIEWASHALSFVGRPSASTPCRSASTPSPKFPS